MADLAQPLNTRMPVVTSEGIPTEFFIQWAQQFSKETEDELLVKVEGPASSTDTAIARFDGATGALLKDSVVTINDVGTFNGVSSINLTGQLTITTGNNLLFRGDVSGTNFPRLFLRRSRGTVDSPTESLANDYLGRYDFRGHTGSAFGSPSVYINARASENGSAGAGGYLEFATTPNGGTVPVVRLTINQDGTVVSAGDITVPDEAYGAGWNGSLEVPTKNAVYDKIETMGGGGGGSSAPSFFNPGGMAGDRRLVMTATATGSFTGNPNLSLQGNPADNFFWAASAGAQSLLFDFVTACRVTEILWYQSVAAAQGTWQVEGSNDNVTWTSLGTGLAPASSVRLSFAFTNTNSYRYYRMSKTSGSTSGAPYVNWFVFKVLGFDGT